MDGWLLDEVREMGDLEVCGVPIGSVGVAEQPGGCATGTAEDDYNPYLVCGSDPWACIGVTWALPVDPPLYRGCGVSTVAVVFDVGDIPPYHDVM